MCNDIQDQIILFSILGKVFPSVINDVVCAERAHKVQLAGVIYASYFSAIQFCKLDSKRTGPAARAINQNFLAWLDLTFFTNPLQGDHSRLRNGCCFLECQVGWFQCPGFCTSTDILGKTTMIVPH